MKLQIIVLLINRHINFVNACECLYTLHFSGPPKMTPFDEKMVELDFLKYETKVQMKKLNSCRFRYMDWFGRKCQTFLDAVKLTQIIAAKMIPAEIKTMSDFRKVADMSRRFPRNGTPRDAGPAKMDDFMMFWSEMLEMKETTDELYEKLCKYYESVERLRQPSIKMEIDRLYDILNSAHSEDFDFTEIKNERDNLFVYKVAPFDYRFHGLMGYIPYLLNLSLKMLHWLGKCHLEKE